MDLGKMMRKHGYYAHKWGDVRYAHCPFCNKFFALPKAEKKPDYLIAKTYAYVEAKGAGDSWQFNTSFTPNQIEFMNDPANISNSWIFVEMGTGRAPTGKKAFLMTWARWLVTERELLENGYKSLLFEKTPKSRSPVVEDYVSPDWMLTWEKGGWIIPPTHNWWCRR